MAATVPVDSLNFAVWCPDDGALSGAVLLAESLRRFGGALAGAPLRVLLPPALGAAAPAALDRLSAFGAERADAPEPTADEAWWFYGGKARAAAAAEAEAAGRAGILAWVDDDTVWLDEPAPLRLPAGIELGWRPVMHRNVGSPAGEPLDAVWSRVCRLLDCPPEALFEVRTVADGEPLRAYLNAGCLALRPEAGLLGRWAEGFARLAGDGELRRAAEADPRWRVFLHQAALSAVVARDLPPERRLELPAGLNFPLFFREMFGAGRDFHDLAGVLSLRHEGWLLRPQGDWSERLTGPADRLAWLRAKAEEALRGVADR